MAAIAGVHGKNSILVGQRPPHASLAGFWEFPGGKVLVGETPADAAVRECIEETGISVEIVRQLSTIPYHYAHGPVELHFFECRPVADENLRLQMPHNPFVWWDRCELQQLHFPPANTEIVRSLCLSP